MKELSCKIFKELRKELANFINTYSDKLQFVQNIFHSPQQ